ncbi:MAG: hypothetical protein M0P76_01295 [Candidatus Pacebacteria bacterium]|nr:hypothetical protein [Candidatus Paceibacterota bacterium]
MGVIEKAKISCENNGEVIHNHFVDTTDMVGIGELYQKTANSPCCFLIFPAGLPVPATPSGGRRLGRFTTSEIK